MESIELDLESFDCLEAPKCRTHFDFPVVSFFYNPSASNMTAIFNKPASFELGDTKYMHVYLKGNWLVFVPTNTLNTKSFKIIRMGKAGCRMSVTSFTKFGVMDKRFKLYKAKNGYAIKLNEPL